MESKKELRKRMLAELKAMSREEKQNLESKLIQRFIHSSVWIDAQIIGITMAQSHEWDTKQIMEAAWAQGKSVCLPKCYPDSHQMIFYIVDSFDSLEVVYFGLQEPNPHKSSKIDKDAIDLLVVPGLLFDELGYRVGYGGGYYDRFLNGFKGNTVSIAATWQLTEYVPKESHDVPVQQIVTDNELLTCHI